MCCDRMNSLSFCLFFRQFSKMKKVHVKSEEHKLSSPVSTNKNGIITLNILAKPGAKTNSITDVSPEGISVQIASKPVDGEANMELMKYMSQILGIKKNEISLDKGSKSRQKTLLINNKNSTVDGVIAKIKEEVNK